MNNNVSFLFATPKRVALLFAGAALCDAFKITKKQSGWQPVMGGLSILGVILGGVCYWKSNQKYWLFGGALMGSLWPYKSIEPWSILKKLSQWFTKERIRVIIAILAAAVFYEAEIKSTQQLKLLVNGK